MNITANRLELLSAAQDAEKVAPTRSVLDVLRCTCLATENGKLTVASGNLELALERRIPAEIVEEGRVVIEAGLLSSMLRLMDSDRVTIEHKENHRATVTGGKTSYGITVLDAADYPRLEIPFPEDTVSVIGIPAMAKRTVFAVAEEDTRPMMKCVHLIFSGDGLRAVGSDGFRIAAAKGDSKATGSVDMLVPAPSLEKLSQLIGNKDTLKVGTTGKNIVFLKEDFLFSARLMEGEYFDADQLMGRVRPVFTILTDTDLLKRALSSVYTLTGEQNRFSITFSGARLNMRCESEYGASEVGLDVVPLSGNPAGMYWYNPAKLLECLRAQNGTMMLELAQNGALILRTDELVCLQMATREPKPIVIRQKEVKPKAEPKGKMKKTKDAALPAAA